MRLRVGLDPWVARLLSAMAIVPAAGCGSTTETTPEIEFTCEEPAPYLAGADTGYVRCKSGAIHREQVAQCASVLPRPETCPGDPAVSMCQSDADCTDAPNGSCNMDEFGSGGCYCSYGCTSDAECNAGAICLCGDTIGRCVSSSCTSDADCGDGLCSTYVSEPGCGGLAFACQSPQDECAADSDCTGTEQCTLQSGHRVCVEPMCAIGRPFLVAGEARVAQVTARRDWSAELCPRLDGVTAAEREALAAHWTQAGQMEHASIAAFARFSLHLLSMGAPPGLLLEAQAAMADETEHARVCFALASAYAGRPVGPGALPMDRALDGGSAREIVVTAIREGCVGETAAAIEAAEAAAHAEDPAVRAALEKIAADETRHAELAWRFVAWAIGVDPALRAAAERELAAVATEARGAAVAEARGASATGEDEGRLLRLGAVGEALRREIRRRAIAEVVRPCAEALLARPAAAPAVAWA